MRMRVLKSTSSGDYLKPKPRRGRKNPLVSSVCSVWVLASVTEGYPADSIAANTVEALLGALYLDGGLEAVESVFEYKFDQWVADSDSLGDPKSRLQEACHQQDYRHLAILWSGKMDLIMRKNTPGR